MAIEAELQAQVDTQLMEQGAFAPLDLLFNSGRLIYGDYEAWRRREIELLDDVLMGDRAKILAELERAAAYARSIGLVEQPQDFSAWGQEAAGAGGGVAVRAANKPLRISAEPTLHRLIGCRYLPAQSAPQMDLFFDNPVVALANGIARALAARNLSESQRQLDRLYVQAPNHPDLASFDRLLGALQGLNIAVDDVGERVVLLLEIGPSARRLLGTDSRDFLSPLWRQLADALGATSFAADAPQLHRSFALSHAQDWVGVGESVLRESEWWLHPQLCVRLADSSFRRRRRVEGLAAWCHLCWRAPEQVAEWLEKLRQPDLSSLWRRFQDSEEEALESASASGPVLTASDFPAWLLLHEPGLARQLSVDLPTGDTPSEQHYKCIHRWIHAHRAHREQEEMALRKSLQSSHPTLFAMLKRSVGN
jgi:hypothetical protein